MNRKQPSQPRLTWLKELMLSPAGILISIAIVAAAAQIVLPLRLWLKSVPQVIVYTSQDQVFAEPILKEFTKQTGVKVRAVYDSEAVKTVGLANRLFAEREHPQCDVFWSNEEMRTRQLATMNLFRETNDWKAIGFRSRQFVINTKRVAANKVPRSLTELTNVAWRGKIAIAYPLFGTTAAHFLALRQAWGEQQWLQWCRALQANKPFLVDGNSVVVKMVARGEAWVGLTDCDDIVAARLNRLPVRAAPIAETLLIPNTVAVVRGAPHPDAAQKLVDYLTSDAVRQKLVDSAALDGVASFKPVSFLAPDWPKLLAELEVATKQVKEIFLR